MHPVTQPQPGPAATRETIHDLRNLFGVVASAGHLLERRPHRVRRKQLLDAIEGAALRGSQLTTAILGRTEPAVLPLDVNQAIARLKPMIAALVGSALNVRFDLCPGQACVRAETAALEAILLELVRNARSAAAPHGRLLVRTRRVGRRLRLTVADDGAGMDLKEVRDRLAKAAHASVNGTGLIRVEEFAVATHGRFRIRSRPGLGTIVSLNLPTLLSLGVDEPTAQRARPIPQPEEISHEEDRQSAAA